MSQVGAAHCSQIMGDAMGSEARAATSGISMRIAFTVAGTTMIYTPWPAPLAFTFERDTMTEALIDFERRYAHELGYALGPDGEWISREPLEHASER